MKFFKRRGCAPQARSFQPYFQFWKLWGNNKHTFFSSKNMHFFTLIHLPLIIFSPTWLNIHGPQGEGGGSNRKIYTLDQWTTCILRKAKQGPGTRPTLLKLYPHSPKNNAILKIGKRPKGFSTKMFRLNFKKQDILHTSNI